MTNNMPIGLFDSGVGGLTVLREVMALLPHESTIYFGDTARVPYGSKSQEMIIRFSSQISQYLIQEEVKMIVVACNTASAYALPTLRSRFPVPVIGVVAPGARAAIQATRSRRVGVIGTEGTIESEAYRQAIHYVDQAVVVIGQACPLIVPLVEEGWLDKPVALEIVKEYLLPLLEKNIDTLVLGCSHYPFLKDLLAKVAGPSIRLIDSAAETARSTAAMLKEKGLEASAGNLAAVRRFMVSDDPQKFERIGERFLMRPIPDVAQVDIGSWL